MTNPTPAPLSAEQLNQQLAEFEAWAGIKYRHAISYTAEDHKRGWAAWQAALIAQAQLAQPECESCENGRVYDTSHTRSMPCLNCAAQAHHAAATTGEDARDAARWRTALRFVGAVPAFTTQKFILDALQVSPEVNLLRGSVAEHFTKAIDAAMFAPNAIQNNEGSTNV